MDASEKGRLLGKGETLYLYDLISGQMVKIVPPEWKTFIKRKKSPNKEGTEVDYDKSTVAGDAFVYGEVKTKEDWDNF